MAKIEKYPIDGKKLKREVILKGYSLTEASRKLGFANNYITNRGSLGWVPLPSVKLIESILEIPYEAYKLSDPEETKATDDTEKYIKEVQHIIHDVVNLEELKDVIYNAVYQAVKDAWMDDEPKPAVEEKDEERGLVKIVPYV